MRPQSGIRVTTLVIAALVTALVSGLVLRLLDALSTATTSIGWVGIAVMLFLAGGLVVAGWQVRQTRDGKAERPVSGLRAARTLVLGQAGALTGAALVGWYGIQALMLVPDLDVDSRRAAFWLLLGHLAAALALAVAGMIVQAFCRVLPRDDDDDAAGPGVSAA